MKYAINTTTMTPHDPARKFFPEFVTLTVCVAGKKITGPATVDIDDRGRAELHFGEVPKVEEVVAPKVVENKPKTFGRMR